LPVASRRPSRENTADAIDAAPRAINRAKNLRAAKSHKITVLSVELVAMVFPSGENTIALIHPVRSTGKVEDVPAAKSQSSGSLNSPPPETSDLPSGAKATACTAVGVLPVQS